MLPWCHYGGHDNNFQRYVVLPLLPKGGQKGRGVIDVTATQNQEQETCLMFIAINIII